MGKIFIEVYVIHFIKLFFQSVENLAAHHGDIVQYEAHFNANIFACPVNLSQVFNVQEIKNITHFWVGII